MLMTEWPALLTERACGISQRLVRVLPGLILCIGVSVSADEATVSFSRDIRPLLNSACMGCHGFDKAARKAELRLDQLAVAAAELRDRGILLPGDPNASELIRRITSTDPELLMPPQESEVRLTTEQIHLLQRWVQEGAVTEEHWGFVPPAEPDVPEVSDPDRFVKSPVDQFILRRLQQEGLTPAAAADRSTLIRRVAFVLTGLPPSPEQQQAFFANDDPQAYEQMVEVFLESPHYGEERARHWLDLARYADTHGLHLDNERQMWLWRDWVVSAFNSNLPFDEFTRWQLAGDLLPDASTEQQIATGFNRCNVSTSEGGSIAEEWVYRYAVDRTSTMMQTWMGLTAGCAVCHDHKYDPISSREFYSLYSFFYSAADPGMDGNIEDTRPFLRVPDAEQEQQIELHTEILKQAEQAFEQAWLRQQDHLIAQSADAVQRTDVLIDEVFPAASSVRNTTRNSAVWQYEPNFGVPSGRRCLELAWGERFDLTVDFGTLPLTVPDDAVLSLQVRTDEWSPPQGFAVQFSGAGGQQAVWGDAAEVGTGVERGALPERAAWQRLEVPLQDLGINSGARLNSLVLRMFGGRMWVDSVVLTGKRKASDDPAVSFGKWLSLASAKVPTGISEELQAALRIAATKRTAAQLEALQRWWGRHIQRPESSVIAEELVQVRAAESNLQAVRDRVPGTLVFRELEQPRPAFVMLRGQYDQPGEAVVPGVPAALTSSGNRWNSTADRMANRLDLVEWLLSDENPLTARVAVNRIWQQVFGTGLVSTSEDFGTQGELPSHPELLDWLAWEFRRSGWDQKQMFRLLLNSAVFRMESRVSEQLQQRDPGNRLLARGPRLRLDAEQIRDNALFVSGLLDMTMGGRGVRGYQPEKIWEPVGYANSNTRFYLQDHGASLYRRSLYTFIKRTAPPPFMANFDAPNREQFCAQRARSNTPLQALQLMNDVQHFEAARALAERLLREDLSDDSARLERLFRIILARVPGREEQAVLQRSLQAQRQLFMSSPAAAADVLKNGESQPAEELPVQETAAWTMLCNLVLNLDEVVCRN